MAKAKRPFRVGTLLAVKESETVNHWGQRRWQLSSERGRFVFEVRRNTHRPYVVELRKVGILTASGMEIDEEALRRAARSPWQYDTQQDERFFEKLADGLDALDNIIVKILTANSQFDELCKNIRYTGGR